MALELLRGRAMSCRTVIFLFATAFAILASACGGDDASASDSSNATSSGSGGSGGGGGAGGSSACPVGTHEGPNGCEATLTGWTDGPPLGQARDHHVTFVAVAEAGPFIYAAGG